MDYIKFLGANGARTSTKGALSIQIDESAVIDAGNIIMGLSDRAFLIDKIFLSHSHIDHICDIPFLIEDRVLKATAPLKIYASKETLQILQDSILNNRIWPDFTNIKLINSSENSVVELVEIEFDKEYKFKHFSILPFETNHTKGSCGFVVKKFGRGIAITSDTYCSNRVWELINDDESIDSLCIDVSFPSRFDKLANDSKHLTPKLLKQETKKLKREINIYPIHIKPTFFDEVVKEIQEYKILTAESKVVEDGDLIFFKSDEEKKNGHFEIRGRFDLITQKIYDVAVALSSENDTKKLLAMVLKRAKEITNSDAGTIYMLNDKKDTLEFAVVENDTLNIDINNQDKINWKKLPLYDKNGKPNRNMASVLCAMNSKTINIDDAYKAHKFDFSGTKEFDELMGYRSKSMLVIPLFDYEDRVIGVLQLINKKTFYKKIISFNRVDEKIVLALASIAGSAITKDILLKDIEILFENFIDSINLIVKKESEYSLGQMRNIISLILITTEALKSGRVFEEIKNIDTKLVESKIISLINTLQNIGTLDGILEDANRLQNIYERLESINSYPNSKKKELLVNYLRIILKKIDVECQIAKDYTKELSKIGQEVNSLKKRYPKSKINFCRVYESIIESKSIKWSTNFESF
jgi:phosphoribosyl 1,2-cyclic phosphodiesterase